MARNAHDFMTERALIAAMIQWPRDTAAAFLSVPVDAFYHLKHQALAAIVREKLIDRAPIDANTVLAAVMDQGLISRIPGPELMDILQHPAVPAVAGEYAKRICELYGRRRMAEEFAREIQYLDAAWESGDAQPVAATLERVRVMLEEVAQIAAPLDEQRPPTLADLLAGTTEFDWVVPGLLERMDRLILTGDEGFGKSEFIAQVLCCIAAGVHPFTTEEIQGMGEVRVAIFDCENSLVQSRRRYRRMVRCVDGTRAVNMLPPVSWDKRLYIDFAPGGLDLIKGGDFVRLERFVSQTAPDVLAVGPLYKLHRSDLNNEEVAREVTGKLDQLRERYGCAIITEAHAGNAKDSDGNRFMRPRGSSLLIGWPEFGLGLRRDKNEPETCAEVVPWRGARDERSWPIDLIKAHDGLLPWRPGLKSAERFFDNPGNWEPGTE
jgi:hypothetical protein